MAYELEARPWMTDPGYWGYDIHDTAALSVPTVCPWERTLPRGAAASLAQDALGVLDGSTIATQHYYSGEISSAADIRLGDVMILEDESLTKARIPGGSDLADILDTDLPTDARPIDAPFLEYWRAHQGVDVPSFGEEVAFFPEHGMQYTRALSWGVIVREGRRQLALATCPIGELSVTNKDVRFPTKFEYVWLPLGIKNTEIPPSVTLGAFSLHGLYRVRSVTLLGDRDEPIGPLDRLRVRIAQRLQAVLGPEPAVAGV